MWWCAFIFLRVFMEKYFWNLFTGSKEPPSSPLHWISPKVECWSMGPEILCCRIHKNILWCHTTSNNCMEYDSNRLLKALQQLFVASDTEHSLHMASNCAASPSIFFSVKFLLDCCKYENLCTYVFCIYWKRTILNINIYIYINRKGIRAIHI